MESLKLRGILFLTENSARDAVILVLSFSWCCRPWSRESFPFFIAVRGNVKDDSRQVLRNAHA